MGISLDGKTAIVTSAGQDIGQAVAQRFLDAGANVMLADCAERSKQTLEGPEERAARFHHVRQDRLNIGNLIAATIDAFDRIDILVNAAQTQTAPGTFLELATDEFDAAFGENVRGVYQLSQAVAKRMIEHGGEDGSIGSIVNISSIAAVRTVPELLTLSVSYAALDQLTRSMAVSLAPHRIRVNGVALGGVLTERLRAAFKEHEDLRQDMVAVTPLGRLGDLEEAAEAALFVASDHASYVTGQVMAADGGRSLLDPLASPFR